MKTTAIALCLLLVLSSSPVSAQSWGNLLEKGLGILENQLESQDKEGQAPSAPPATSPSPQPQYSPEPTIQQQTPGKQAAPVPQPASSGHPNRFNADKMRVAKAQNLLNQLGYSVGPEDGIYGRKTRSGIRAFEADRGLPPRGDVTDALLTQLSLAAVSTGDHQAAGTRQAAGASQSAQIAISSDIRRPAPVQVSGRLLSGYPLTYVKRYTEDVFVGRSKHPESSSRFNLGLHFDLAVLRTWPQLLDTSKAVFEGQRTADDYRLAHTYAERFLTGNLLLHYLGECGIYGCTSIGNSAFAGWAGGDEFEREASYRAFLREVVPDLLAMAPGLPVSVLHVVEVQLQSYDKTAGGFPLRDRRKIGESPFADIRFATNLQVESAYKIPGLVKVAEARGSSFLAPLKNRNAYFAADLSVGDPRWDYRLDRPVLQAQWSNPRLYADPELKQLIHRFPDAGGADALVQSSVPAPGKTAHSPAPAVIAEANAPDATPLAVKLPDMAKSTRIPLSLLVYKFLPTAFSEERLLKATSDQVTADGSWYEISAKGHMNNSLSMTSHVLLFSEEQVAGRVPDFAARELLPVYKQRLGEFAQRVPRHLTINDKIRLDFFVFEDRTLHIEPARGRPKEKFHSMPLLFENERRILPPIGARVVRRDIPELWGVMDTAGIPQTMGRLRVIRKQYLALDRDPTVPPLRLDPTVAEQQWRRPECRVTDSHYLRQGMTPKQAQEAARKCQMQFAGYRDHFRIAYHIEIEGVELAERAAIVKAKLLGADVYGTRNELLQHFDAESFVPAKDNMAVETAETHELEAERKAAAEKYEMLGLQAGMPVDEAQALVLAHLKEAVVYEYDARDTKYSSTVGVYRYARFFVANGDKEVIGLYWDPAQSDRLAAASRSISFTPAQREAIETTLERKYGEPVAVKRGIGWGKRLKNERECWAQDNFLQGGALTPLQGSQDEALSRQRMPHLNRFMSAYGDMANSRSAKAMRECLPAIMAQFDETENVLRIYMYDLAVAIDQFLGALAAKENAAEAAAVAPDNLDIKF